MSILKLPSWCILLLLSALVLPISSICLFDKHYIIRSRTAGLVVDSTSDRVTLSDFTGFDPQLWCFEYTSGPGIMNIVSVDPYGRALEADTVGTGHSVYLSDRHSNSVTQQWFVNSDGTISNVGSNNLCLDGLDGNITVANALQINNCSSSETWILQER